MMLQFSSLTITPSRLSLDRYLTLIDLYRNELTPNIEHNCGNIIFQGRKSSIYFKIGRQLWDYLSHCWEDTEIHTFLKGISPKLNVIAWLEFELSYYDITAQQINQYAEAIPTKVPVWAIFGII